jgi:hypothetical protein
VLSLKNDVATLIAESVPLVSKFANNKTLLLVAEGVILTPSVTAWYDVDVVVVSLVEVAPTTCKTLPPPLI